MVKNPNVGSYNSLSVVPQRVISPGNIRIAPRIILPVGKKMHTRSVLWGKITRGGTRGVGWDAPFPKSMPLPSDTITLLLSEKAPALFDERDAPSRGKMEEADEGFKRFFELWCPPRSAGADRTPLPGSGWRTENAVAGSGG